jgi:dihydrofolate reductase
MMTFGRVLTRRPNTSPRIPSHWCNGSRSVFLSGDIAAKVAEIKQQPGPDLHVWGSGNLVQTLIKHDLVDVFWLMMYPITLGGGKRLFADGTIPAAFKVTESLVTQRMASLL